MLILFIKLNCNRHVPCISSKSGPNCNSATFSVMVLAPMLDDDTAVGLKSILLLPPLPSTIFEESQNIYSIRFTKQRSRTPVKLLYKYINVIPSMDFDVVAILWLST